MTVELTDKIHLVPGRRGGRYPHCNSLLIGSGERAIIDPGSDRKALRALAEEGVGRVLLSHSHSDHLRDLKEFPDSRTFIHHSDRAAVESMDQMLAGAFFPDEDRDPVWERRKNREVGGWGWPVAGTFGGGDEIAVGEVELQVIHTPGHTAGHCCFWFPDQRILYSADIDLTDFGPWYGNYVSSVAAFRDSIELLKGLEPAVTVTGHEAGVIEGDIGPLLDKYLAVLETRHGKILDFIEIPRSLDEVVARGFVYGQYYSPNDSTHHQEKRMVRHHLKEAVERGEAEEREGLYSRGR